ncbi:MAG: exodeoxyribonuclease VII large subunit [Deltaproteobacteria bacterium]|nr:exodeoxyribonuclease VII large subunit [Deltaproteobacteria bacterium]
MGQIFSVRDLTEAVKTVVEGEFPFVRVRGQIGNLTRAGSGHVYFNLKDEAAVLAVVWFKSSRSRHFVQTGERIDPLTGEVFEADPLDWLPSEGSSVLCAGRLAVYAPRGVYQLVAELVQEDGVGNLHIQFEALKQELAGLGFFDQSRKRSLPVNPKRVAVIAAPTGAAIQDFLEIGACRGTGGEIRMYPSLVQGSQAPEQLARAVERCGRDGWAEVLVLVRGGGSLEDLWAFNSKELALALASSPIPVITGVGHEVDVTIADLVVDIRAATPSHAAQLLWTDRESLFQRLDEAGAGLARAWNSHERSKVDAIRVLERELSLLSPVASLERSAKEIGKIEADLARAMTFWLDGLGQRVETRVEALTSCRRLEFWERRMEQLSIFFNRFESSVKALVRQSEAALELAWSRLEGLDPLRPLGRGYALVRGMGGELVVSSAQVHSGERLDIGFHDGQIPVRVLEPSDAEGDGHG